jgi:hypothetical protein
MLVEFETDIGAKTICPSVVPNEIAVRRLTEDPAKRVGRFVVAIRIAKEQKSISPATRAEATYSEYCRQKTNASGGRGFRLPLC